MEPSLDFTKGRELVGHALAAHAHETIEALTPLTPNTDELIPFLGALSPRGGPAQDPVLTREEALLQVASPVNSPTLTPHTDEHGPFVKGQLASCNRLQGLMCCKYGHATLTILRERNRRNAPNGHPAAYTLNPKS